MRGFTINHHTTILGLQLHTPSKHSTHLRAVKEGRTCVSSCPTSMGYCRLQASRQQVHAGIQDS